MTPIDHEVRGQGIGRTTACKEAAESDRSDSSCFLSCELHKALLTPASAITLSSAFLDADEVTKNNYIKMMKGFF